MSTRDKHAEDRSGYAAAVRAYAGALRAGSTATWAEFRQSPVEPAPVGEGPLPGAGQLEVVRRLAVLHAASPLPRFAGLADLVLGSSGPGRGLVDPPLPWPTTTVRFGPDPTEPDRLPGNELVRAASGVLVPLLLGSQTRPRRSVPSRWRRLLPGRPRFEVVGSPLTAAEVRSGLLAAGWVEGGSDAVQLVVGRDLETMMAELWVARTRTGAERRWRPLWRAAVTAEQVPPRLRLDEIAARRALQHGSAAVHLILGRDEAEIAVGVREAIGAELRLEPVRVDVIAADLLRRLNPFLVLAGGTEGRRTAVDGAWSLALAAVAADRRLPDLGAPRGLLRWAIGAATAMADRVAGPAATGDYAVHGDPAVLVPERHREVPRAVDPDEVVSLAIAMIATLWCDRTEGDA